MPLNQVDFARPASNGYTMSGASSGTGAENWREWPVIGPVPPGSAQVHPLAAARFTPFRWFWKKWCTLCDPANSWRDALPARRFTDWALCLLRTGLAFAYLWEAEFFRLLHKAIIQTRDNSERSARCQFLHSRISCETGRSPRIDRT